jgi:hypothetical protein
VSSHRLLRAGGSKLTHDWPMSVRSAVSSRTPVSPQPFGPFARPAAQANQTAEASDSFSASASRRRRPVLLVGASAGSGGKAASVNAWRGHDLRLWIDWFSLERGTGRRRRCVVPPAQRSQM